MLDTMRRGAQGWIGKILFGILVIGFGFWGISGTFSGYGRGSLAKVGDVEIPTADFQQTYQTQFENLRRRFGGRVTQEQARAIGFDQQVLSQLIGAAAIDNHTRELQLGLSDQAVAERLKSDPRFAGADGKFNAAALDQFLRQNGLSKNGFLNIARKDEIRDQLTIALVESVNVPDAMLNILHRYRDEKRKLSFFALDPTKVPAVGEPDDAKIDATYEANKRRFMTPERRTATLLMLTVDEVKKTITVSDEEIKAAYDQNPERFNIPEKRRLQQIAFADGAKATVATAELAAGKSFLDVAKENGAAESDVDLGLVTKKQMIDQKVADAAFALAKDAVSAPIAGRFATVVVKVMEIEPGKQKALDEVKGELKAALVAEKAAAEIQKLHDQIEDGRASGKLLKEIGADLKLSVTDLVNIDQSGKGADGKSVLEGAAADIVANSVFAAKVGIDGDAAELPDGGYAWVDVSAVAPPKQRELAEVKPEVKAYWIESETRRAINAAADAFASRLAKGDPIDKVAEEAGGKLVTSDPILRGGKPVGLTEQAVQRAFALPKGGASATDTLDGKSRLIVRVDDIIAADPLKPEEMKTMRAEVQRQMQSDTIAEYLAGLQERIGVKINADELRRAVGADRDQQ